MKAGSYQMLLVECVSVCIRYSIYSIIMICLDQRTKLLNYMNYAVSPKTMKIQLDFFEPVRIKGLVCLVALLDDWCSVIIKGPPSLLLKGIVRRNCQEIPRTHSTSWPWCNSDSNIARNCIQWRSCTLCVFTQMPLLPPKNIAESKKCQLAFFHVKKVDCLYNTPPFPSISYP